MPTLTPQQVEDAARAMPDHTLATSFLEPEARARVIALILFTHEIARARKVVSEPGLAAIRLQWWRDTIDQVYTGQTVRAQPTATALAGAIREAGLPRTLIDDMIDAYACELEAAPFATWTDLQNYLDATAGNLARLCLLATGLPAITSSTDEAARQVGIAAGLAHLVATTPNWLEQRRSWLPQEASQTFDNEAMFAGQISAGLHGALNAAQTAITNARNRANQNLRHAKLGSSFAVLAPACLAQAIARSAMPRLGKSWQIGTGLTLFERQLRITASVARGRI
jgi:phytoene/squalene synthetase